MAETETERHNVENQLQGDPGLYSQAVRSQALSNMIDQMKSALICKLASLDVGDFYLTSIHSLPLTLSAKCIQFPFERPHLSQSAPEVGVADLPSPPPGPHP